MIIFCRECGKETCNEGDICFPCAYPPKPRCVHGLTHDCEKCKVNYIDEIMADIKTLNDRIDGLVALIDKLEKIRIKDKHLAVKPYVCPVCEGMKIHKRMMSMAGQLVGIEDNCICCEGKGIVWG